MDSVNLSETQSTPLNCKNTASNTSPVTCVCCGLKDYVQAFPQAYCFTPLHPGIPKCKHFQESFEENFKFQQPFFSSPPLYHPFFYNIFTPISQNFCWAQNREDEAASNKQQNQTNEHESIQISSNSCNSCLHEINNYKSNEAALEEDAQKRNNAFPPKISSLGHHVNMPNLIESQISSFFQRFAGDSSIPWTCSPFIAPIISYCLMWNSQNSNMNASTSQNFTSGKSETLDKKSNENSVSQKFSNHKNNNIINENSHNNSSSSSSSNNNNNNNNNNNDDDDDDDDDNGDDKETLPNTTGITESTDDLAEKKNYSQEEGLEIDQQVESNDQNSGKSSTFLSLNSLNSFKHLEKDDHNRSNDVCAEEEGEDTEIEGFDFEDQEESEECLKSNKKNLSNKNSNAYISLDSDYNLKESECQSPLGSPSYTNLKVMKNRINSEDGLSSEDITPTEEKCFNSLQDSDDESEKTPLKVVSDFKEQTPSKKFIKNFTVTNQTNSIPFKEEKISVAAAGDLGGETCAGYKTDISSFEDVEGKAGHETQNRENLESSDMLLKGLRNLEEKKSDRCLEKSANESLTKGRLVKSSIAKLSKTKDSKPEPLKNVTQNKEFNQKEIGIMKRKHSCFQSDNNTASVLGKSMKFHKTKNSTTVQQHFTGQEKPHKETNSKIQTLKKEEKSLATKVRPLSTTQKTVKNTCKK